MSGVVLLVYHFVSTLYLPSTYKLELFHAVTDAIEALQESVGPWARCKELCTGKVMLLDKAHTALVSLLFIAEGISLQLLHFIVCFLFMGLRGADLISGYSLSIEYYSANIQLEFANHGRGTCL
jgi:hypothetical protein